MSLKISLSLNTTADLLMTLQEYIHRFNKAALFCHKFTQLLVVENLPNTIRFNITWNEINETINTKNYIKFLGGRLLYPEDLKNINYIKTRKMLWIDGKIPQWINMYVSDIIGDTTLITISLCNQIAADTSKLYHSQEGNPPFHILSPLLPQGWESIEKNGKFSLIQ